VVDGLIAGGEAASVKSTGYRAIAHRCGLQPTLLGFAIVIEASKE
jgi:hypothetical protein